MNQEKNKNSAISYLEKNKKVRKVSDCKSVIFEPQIMELLNKDVDISKIAKKLKLSITTVKKVARNNGIDIDGRIKSGKLKQKTERNERIYKMLLQGKKYQDIADKMKVTKQRIYEIATFHNFSRWEESRKKHKEIIEKVQKDIDLCLSYKFIIKKHNLTKSQMSKLCYYGLQAPIKVQCREKRNKKIGTEYVSGKKAIEIIASKDKVLNNPQNIKGVSNIYSICTKQGIYKYPKVGRRIDGGSSEDVSILRLVKKLRDEKELSFEEIANHLNAKKHKTVCGKRFNFANARFKYYDAIREGL